MLRFPNIILLSAVAACAFAVVSAQAQTNSSTVTVDTLRAGLKAGRLTTIRCFKPLHSVVSHLPILNSLRQHAC